MCVVSVVSSLGPVSDGLWLLVPPDYRGFLGDGDSCVLLEAGGSNKFRRLPLIPFNCVAFSAIKKLAGRLGGVLIPAFDLVFFTTIPSTSRLCEKQRISNFGV